ncbi:hypothetical protein [Flavobacterium filum]|uniref:hypothetical protein n=2 Tax=Flavobacteriaceae TaxID=49546 RepID=UPI00041FA47E|nr:hypothetical protein [Flavobacterium filum]
MDFYYKSEIELLEKSCPPLDYYSKKINCYRWVFENINDKNNFKAQADKNPSILNNKSDIKKCEYFALSFHDTEENSRNHFNYLNGFIKNAKKRFGTHIAFGNIEENDGVCGLTDQNGHFNYHHVKNHNFQLKFKIISLL